MIGPHGDQSTSAAPRRSRILFLIDYAVQTGGAERFAVGLATHLPRERFEPWICTTRSADGLSVAALAAAGVRHVNLGRRAKWDVHKLVSLAALMRRERFDILHTHKFGSNVWGTVLGRAAGVPVIVAHEHSWSYSDDPLRKWLDRYVISRLATRFVAVSEADGKRMVNIEGIRADKVVVIPNGYVPSPGASRGDLRAELGLTADTPLIAIAAMLRPEKRLDLLLDAYGRVLQTIPQAHLAIAGDGECRFDLEQQATELGVATGVHFLGNRLDVDDILRAADVAALSSDREGSPLLAFECMATGTPLVATAVGGLPEIVEDGRTGVLVPRRDVLALADGIVELLGDPERRMRLGVAARERLARFTIDATAKRFAELYETLTLEVDDQ